MEPNETPKDCTMNAAPRDHLLTPGQRALLEAELKLRQDELDRTLAAHQGGLGRVEHAEELLAQDGDDAPQRDADREVDLARSDRTMQELGRVSLALRRVHDADYGVCRDCDEPIPFDRLKLEPWAERCVKCEAATEGRGPSHPTL